MMPSEVSARYARVPAGLITRSEPVSDDVPSGNRLVKTVAAAGREPEMFEII